ncbi:hypothetical protein [Deinococcus ruber]|uniref:Uncharacterized protein n=1 Tax=Deinococcus ruber TaxID=1848197 RepID=A0A918BUC5_9DEIO|nr:hypothetical protein [Deinococcus ruber]GGQ93045.1 hypothetical protein GCM10008957_01260 [Deinococcus ruber]
MQAGTAFESLLESVLARVAAYIGWTVPPFQLAADERAVRPEGTISVARPIDFDDVLRGFSSDL